MSFHVYNFAWLAVSLLLGGDPMYYILFRYPFHLLTLVPDYINLRGRKVLFDEASVSIHCVDHIIHGMISGRVLVYEYCKQVFAAQGGMFSPGGLLLMVLCETMTVPFCVMMSENFVRVQKRFKVKA